MSKVPKGKKPSKLEKLGGAFELPENFDYKKELTKSLAKKYLKKE